MGIYVGFKTPSIIRYLEPLIGDVFTARFADYQFNEVVFPTLGEKEKEKKSDISWNEPSLLHLDPYTKQCELEVQKIMHLQAIANQLPDAFTDTKRVTKSYIPAANAPARIEIPEIKSEDKDTHKSKTRQKCGRPVGSKDKNPRKRKRVDNHIDSEENIPEKIENKESLQMKDINDINQERKLLNRNEMKSIDEIFSYTVASEITNEKDDPEPKSVMECQNRHDWIKWKDAMHAELDSLNKQNIFGPIIPMPKTVKPVGYKWVFVRKRNEKNEIIRYKARLIASRFFTKSWN